MFRLSGQKKRGGWQSAVGAAVLVRSCGCGAVRRCGGARASRPHLRWLTRANQQAPEPQPASGYQESVCRASHPSCAKRTKPTRRPGNKEMSAVARVVSQSYNQATVTGESQPAASARDAHPLAPSYGRPWLTQRVGKEEAAKLQIQIYFQRIDRLHEQVQKLSTVGTGMEQAYHQSRGQDADR